MRETGSATASSRRRLGGTRSSRRSTARCSPTRCRSSPAKRRHGCCSPRISEFFRYFNNGPSSPWASSPVARSLVEPPSAHARPALVRAGARLAGVDLARIADLRAADAGEGRRNAAWGLASGRYDSYCGWRIRDLARARMRRGRVDISGPKPKDDLRSCYRGWHIRRKHR